MITVERIGTAGIQDLMRLYAVSLENPGTSDYPVMDQQEYQRMALSVLQQTPNPLMAFLVAYDASNPVGFLIGEVINRDFGRPRVYGRVRDLFVLPEYRGGTVGIRLMRKAIHIGKQYGIEYIEAVAQPKSRAASKWALLGFHTHELHMHIKLSDFGRRYQS